MLGFTRFQDRPTAISMEGAWRKLSIYMITPGLTLKTSKALSHPVLPSPQNR